MADAFVTTKQNYANFDQSGMLGEWISLDDFNDASEFQQACENLYPESDVVITDLDEIPFVFIKPIVNTVFYSINEKFWEWKKLPENKQDLCELYWSNVNTTTEITSILENYLGQFSDAQDWIESSHDNVPENFKTYIDYERMLADAQRDEGLIVIDSGCGIHVFRR